MYEDNDIEYLEIPGEGKFLIDDTDITCRDILSESIESQIFRMDSLGIKFKKIDIGVWDMNATERVIIEIGIDNTKIFICGVHIFIDSLVSLYPLNYNNYGRWSLNKNWPHSGDKNIELTRAADVGFAIGPYTRIDINRGYIFLIYSE